MCAEYLAECLVKQVGTRVVGGTCCTFCAVYLGAECGSGVRREFLCYVDREVVLLLCVDNLYTLFTAYKETGVTYLSSALGIERGLFLYYLVEGLVLLLCLAVAQYCCLVLCVVVAHKGTFALAHGNP